MISFFGTLRKENSRLGGIPTLGESRMGRIPAIGEGRHTKGHHRENMILTNLTHPTLGEARRRRGFFGGRRKRGGSRGGPYAALIRAAQNATSRAASVLSNQAPTRGPPPCDPNSGEIDNPQYGQPGEKKCLRPCANGPRNPRTGRCRPSGRPNPGCTSKSIPGCANDHGLIGAL